MSKHSHKRKAETELTPVIDRADAQAPAHDPAAAPGKARRKNRGKAKAQESQPKGRITQEDVRRGIDLLKKYRAGKAQLEARVVDNEQWWKLRHWSVLKDSREPEEFESAWLFNCILNKHADAMDNFPEPVVLPREKGDAEDAQAISEIMPVIMERNGFEEVYDAAWWAKLKFGCGIYGVFWNPMKENGLGDIEIREVDLLNIFWEPGVEDIQRSANVFVVELWDKEQLEGRYPEAKNEPAGVTLTLSDYIHEDYVNKEDKVLVVDWYYKTEDKSGRTRLEYIKFVNDTLLFASENESEGFENGLYDHGKYPFVFDTLFPMAGSPAGFGYVDVCKKPQTMIDTLNKIITKNAWMSGKKRWFIKEGGGVNENEYADWSKDFVHVQGSLGDESIREISVSGVDAFIVSFLQDKIEELKETSGNRDVAQGGTTAGATAASAIAAMQEAAGKLSRDMIRKGYRAMVQIASLVLELIRQFYDQPRSFRITGKQGQEKYVTYTNEGLQIQRVDMGPGEEKGARMPVFDIKVKAQRANPYSTMSQNELMKELYGMGMFNPQLADQALLVLEGMQFEGKEGIIQKVQQNGTMYQQLQAMQEQMAKMAAIIDAQNGTSISQGVNGQENQMSAATPPRVEGSTGSGESSITEKARQRAAQTTAPT